MMLFPKHTICEQINILIFQIRPDNYAFDTQILIGNTSTDKFQRGQKGQTMFIILKGRIKVIAEG